MLRTVLVGLALVATPAFAQTPRPRVFTTERGVEVRHTDLGNGIHVFTSGDDGYVEHLNSLVVINDQDVLVYDTTTRPSTARTIVREIRRLTRKPVTTIVNSHWHPDHWSGNEVFLEAWPQATILATEAALEYMKNAAPAWPARYQMFFDRDRAEWEKQIAAGKDAEGKPLTDALRKRKEQELATYKDFIEESRAVRRTYPTQTYADHLTLHRGGREFRLISLQGDARGTTVLFLPKEKLAATGDLVVWPIPYGTPSVNGMARDLRVLLSLGAETIVPGHGPVQRDGRYVTAITEVLETIFSQVRQALRDGVPTLPEVEKRVDVAALRVRIAGDDEALKPRFDRWVKNLTARAIRDAREQDY